MYRPTMESSTSSQPYQPYSPINTNLDMNFEDLMFNQECNYSQDYSMGHGPGHGSGHCSTHGSAHGLVPSHEVSAVKHKKPSRRAAKAKKDETKEVNEPPKEWTVKEEIALCQEADEAVQETQEFRPMGRDRAKAKKKAAGSASSIVDLVTDKFYNMKKKEKRKTRNNGLIWRRRIES
nr:hypothetical protein [Tanacetum cinerariifolium]